MASLASMPMVLRSLLRSPLFSVPTVLIGGLTAGAALAMVALLRGILLTPLALPEAERLVSLCERHEMLGAWCAIATPTVAEMGRSARSLEVAGAGRTWAFTLQVGDAELITVGGGIAGPGFFEALGVDPVVGRLPAAEEMGEEDGRVVLIDHGLWTTRFAARPDVVGSVVRLGADPHTVIGVLPEGFAVPDIPGAQVWRPLHFGPEDVDRRDWRGFIGVGRLAEGVDVQTARAELAAAYRRLDEERAEIDETWRFDVIPLLDRVVGGIRGQLWMFAAAVGLFVVIGAVNVFGLFFLRFLHQERAEAVRWALGARASHRYASGALEGALVGLGALAVALPSGSGLLRLFVILAPADIPRLDLVRLDPTSLLATSSLALGTVLAAALAAAALTRRRGRPGLVGARASAGVWTRRVRAGLVSLEAALALVLVASAAILARSFQAYSRWDPGFDIEGVASVQLFASTSEVTDAAAAAEAWRQAEEHARRIVGVRSVATVSAGPLFGGEETALYVSDLDPSGPARTLRWYDASPGYFATLGRPLRSGRDLDERDVPGAEAVAVINETLAREAFGAEDALGGTLRLPEADLELRVVGVVSDVAPLVPGEPARAELFWSNRQQPRWGSFLVLRLAPGASTAAVESSLEALEPTISVGTLRPLADRFDAALVRPRFIGFLVAVFAAIATLLASGGLFAVLSVSVAERMRELGIRVALGAERPQVVARTLRGGVGLVAGGVAAGVVLYVVVEPVLVRSVPGVLSAGMVLPACAAAILLLVALAASLPAALRAGRADPLDLLRDAG